MPLVVAVVGDALLDVTIAPSEPMRPGGDVPATVRLGPGGQGANVAVRLSRRGVSVRLACALGDDAAGSLLRGAMEADGVRVDAAVATASGAVAILLGPGGERTMLSHRVPVIRDVDLAGLSAGAQWLIISGYALLDDGALDFAARCAAESPRRAVLGCSLPSAGVSGWRAAVTAARPQLVILNADEARVLAQVDGDDAEALAGALAPELDALVIVTGPRESSAVGRDVRMTVRGTGGEGAIDSTGAGDAFAAAVIAELGLAWPPDDRALRTAMSAALSAAAEVVAVPGAQGAVAAERGVAPR
jgi:sugar/nucleoside kinase (ribokinase family)